MPYTIHAETQSPGKPMVLGGGWWEALASAEPVTERSPSMALGAEVPSRTAAKGGLLAQARWKEATLRGRD